MAADLTRFDFHAKKFYFSDNVRIMTAEEVGQYILLLVESWLGGKDASLPDNPVMLARMARVDSVSDQVLSMFPVVETEHGSRRRNETLYGEWLEALGRTLYHAENGKLGGSSRSEEKTLAARENGKLGGRPSILVAKQNPSENPSENQSETESPIQSKSNQINPNQSKSTQLDGDIDFRLFKRRFKELIHHNLSGDKRTQNDYLKFAEQYGGNVLLECLTDWAQKSGEWASTIKYPIMAFWKALPEYAETALDIIEEEKNQARKNEQVAEQRAHSEQIQAESIERQTAETVKFLTSQPPTTTGEGSVEDFLAGE